MKKVKNGFFKFMIGLGATALAATLAEKYNGWLCLGLWVIMMYIVVKTSYVFSGVVTVIGYIASIYSGHGFDKAFIYVVGFIATVFVIMIYMSRREKIDNEVREKRRKGETPCPYCGSSRTQYIQGYANTHTERKYKRDNSYENVVKTDYIDGYWKCLSCKKHFKE